LSKALVRFAEILVENGLVFNEGRKSVVDFQPLFPRFFFEDSLAARLSARLCATHSSVSSMFIRLAPLASVIQVVWISQGL
jgi:hypothetical protein